MTNSLIVVAKVFSCTLIVLLKTVIISIYLPYFKTEILKSR